MHYLKFLILFLCALFCQDHQESSDTVWWTALQSCRCLSHPHGWAFLQQNKRGEIPVHVSHFTHIASCASMSLAGTSSLSFLSSPGFGWGGTKSGHQVPCARDYADHWGAPLFVTGREPDVPPVGCWCHQYDHSPRGGPRQGSWLVLCQHCHGNGLWLLEGTRGGGEWQGGGPTFRFDHFEVFFFESQCGPLVISLWTLWVTSHPAQSFFVSLFSKHCLIVSHI